MEAGQGLQGGELPKLKRLAGDIVAAEMPDPAVLDEVASLAAAVAVHLREQARQVLLGLVVEAGRAIFPGAGEELRTRLAQSSHAELSSLGALLDDANQARTAFERADSGLMAARDRGDYGAMVPLALEAEEKKKVLATASADFAKRIGFSGDAMPAPAAAAPEEPVANTPDAATVEVSQEADGSQMGEPPAEPVAVTVSEEDAPPVSAAPEPAESPADADPRGDSQAGRRRIRDLIRQVRSMPEEAAAAR